MFFFRPSQIEDAKKVLILQGNKVSQLLKATLVDIFKLKRVSFHQTLCLPEWLAKGGHLHQIA